MPPGHVQQDHGVQGTRTMPPAPNAAELRLIAGTSHDTYDAKGKLCNRACPACQQGVHATGRGDWRCYGCGAAGGSFKGKRLYMTTVPDTDAGRAAAARLAAQW